VPDSEVPPGPGTAPASGPGPGTGPQPGPGTGPQPGPQPGPPRRFSPEVAEALRTYVYLLVDPRTGRPFLVGRGRNDRCFRHLEAARSGADSTAKFPGLERIRRAEADGRHVRIDILRHGLTATQANFVEAVAADALGLDRPAASSPPVGNGNGSGGGGGGSGGSGEPPGQGPPGERRIPVDALDSVLARPAKFKRAHPVVLLRVSPDRLADGIDPEAVRHGWRIARRWTDPDAPHAPRWAVVVGDDLVRGVFRITGWEPSPASAGPGRAGSADPVPPYPRFSFVGTRDPELEGRYVGRSVASYRGTGAPNPVTYVWCGPHWVNHPH